MILDEMDNRARYSRLPAWEKALSFAAALPPDVADGEYPIEGRDIYAVVFSYQTKDHATAVLEAHTRYVDVQAPLSGRELHGRYPAALLAPLTEYDPLRDVCFYHHPKPYASSYLVRAGQFAVYFPQDAHMTHGWVAGTPEPVRKVVMKVKAELLLPA
jgi:YhcH/YjgK/YiaL family protein